MFGDAWFFSDILTDFVATTIFSLIFSFLHKNFVVIILINYLWIFDKFFTRLFSWRQWFSFLVISYIIYTELLAQLVVFLALSFIFVLINNIIILVVVNVFSCSIGCAKLYSAFMLQFYFGDELGHSPLFFLLIDRFIIKWLGIIV